MNNEFAGPGIPPEKPSLLPVLLVLSYINTGFFALFYLIAIFAMMAVQSLPFDEFQARIEEQLATLPQSEDLVGIQDLFGLLHAHGVALFIILFLRTALRLVGVIMMHQRRYTGFHVYAAAQLLGLFAPFIIHPWSMFGIFGPIMTVLMVALYGSQRKWFTRGREVPAGL